ncbi:MAG: ATP-binding cassette domain-containing protein [Acidimicrobiales bacterium]|nr:ATP-binding cassette domain-containing protein [Acidimicrobiales bacterium]
MSGGRPTVRVRGLSKAYGAPGGRTGMGAALHPGTDPEVTELALRAIDLDVECGESLGIIGPNGAGKSTLLKIIAGITRPTAGSIEVVGTARSVIELGAGFHDDLTGLENLRCLGVLHGQTLAQIDEATERVVAFAGLEDAIDLPMKQYSMGMRARLAFAVVTDVRPDVLVVDEVLAVGDQDFQAKCFAHIGAMVAEGTTLVFVSHEMGMVATVCGRVIQLRNGRIVDDGPTREVIERYLTRSAARIPADRGSTARLHPVGVETGATGPDSLRVTVDVDLAEPLANPAIGFDVVLPMVAPDQVVSSSTEALASLSAPGRYRLTGSTDQVWGVGRNMRFVVSLVDRERQRVLDRTALDAEVVGELAGRRLTSMGVAMTVPMRWELHPESEDGHAGLRSSGGSRRSLHPPVVVLDGVTKRYRSRTHGASLRPALPGRSGALRHPDVIALDGLRAEIGPGEAVGLIGPNASGKTTLLRVIAGVTAPDAGTVAVRGRVVSLLELGSGFLGDLTGRENLRVLGRLMGVAARDLDDHVDEAVELAGLGAVIDHRLKTYSTGMTARLGLSMALVCPADLLLIDEVLAVGDEEFRRVAIDRLAARGREGLSVVFVSHDLQLIEQVCERVLRLDGGRCVDDGPTDVVVGAYAGTSWAGGAHDAEGGVRLPRLDVDRRHVPNGGTLTVEGVLFVDEPVPDARLEVALRSPPHSRDIVLSLEEREALSAVIETVVLPGEELTQAGRYRYRCTASVGRLVGVVDVVVTAVDQHRQVVLAEAWEQVVIGSPEAGSHVTFVPGIDWTVQRLEQG